MSASSTGRVRVAIKALIVRDGALLVTVNSHWTPVFYLLPGGGQQFGESMREACVRECREEIGVDVTVGEVAFVRDYIGSRHEFAAQDSHYHQIEVVFWATLTQGAEPVHGPVGDSFPDRCAVGPARGARRGAAVAAGAQRLARRRPRRPAGLPRRRELTRSRPPQATKMQNGCPAGSTRT